MVQNYPHTNAIEANSANKNIKSQLTAFVPYLESNSEIIKFTCRNLKKI